jgi:ABC-type nitrate/sulfonate/bicarbonate transport system ATPase subunit
MKQRVALARGRAQGPAGLRMDEPFGALDAQTREVLQEELLRMWEHERKTVVFVTHSISEAVFLADRIVVMATQPLDQTGHRRRAAASARALGPANSSGWNAGSKRWCARRSSNWGSYESPSRDLLDHEVSGLLSSPLR